MSKSCCENKSKELELLRASQGNVLKIVLVINLVMFFVELIYGMISKSTSLTADSLDMLGDSVVYAFSLYVLNRGAVWRARAGLSKGIIMGFFGVVVLGQALFRYYNGSVPVASTMGIIGGLALIANAACLVLLYKHKADDINMRSTWLCSRNDIIANVGVIGASTLVALTGSMLPDLIVGSVIAFLFIKSSIGVAQEARQELVAHSKVGV